MFKNIGTLIIGIFVLIIATMIILKLLFGVVGIFFIKAVIAIIGILLVYFYLTNKIEKHNRKED